MYRNYSEKVEFVVEVNTNKGMLIKTVKAYNCWQAMEVAKYIVTKYQHLEVKGCATH